MADFTNPEMVEDAERRAREDFLNPSRVPDEADEFEEVDFDSEEELPADVADDVDPESR